MIDPRPCIVIVGGRFKAGGRPCGHGDVRHVEEDPTEPGRLPEQLCLDCRKNEVPLRADMSERMGGRDHFYTAEVPQRFNNPR